MIFIKYWHSKPILIVVHLLKHFSERFHVQKTLAIFLLHCHLSHGVCPSLWKPTASFWQKSRKNCQAGDLFGGRFSQFGIDCSWSQVAPRLGARMAQKPHRYLLDWSTEYDQSLSGRLVGNFRQPQGGGCHWFVDRAQIRRWSAKVTRYFQPTGQCRCGHWLGGGNCKAHSFSCCLPVIHTTPDGLQQWCGRHAKPSLWKFAQPQFAFNCASITHIDAIAQTVNYWVLGHPIRKI